VLHGWSAYGGPTIDESWKSDLERWLAPFLAALGHKVRVRMCPAYVAGLIGAGDRKSIQPMAARDVGVGYDQLHHFIASGVWDAAPLEKVLLAEADNMIVPIDLLFPILDDLLRKGPVEKPLGQLGAFSAEANGKVVVMSVTQDGPAAKAGMRAGDVISDVQDGEVEDLADFYRKLWAAGPAGSEVPIRIVRNGREAWLRVRSSDRNSFLKKPQ